MNRGRGVPSEAGGAGECVHSGGAIGLSVAGADWLQRVWRIAERQKGVARKLRDGKLGGRRWMGYSGQLKYNKRGDTRFVRGRPANQKEH